ncbi:HEAT repeat domain-containing protein [Aneurinibacillus sp. REN35]|uniref:HEAT repeat domain-containing protein n=1 Tax=Aneurinibacillus sp. REN35 TaxID=3237286 RepID=UPI003526ED48
MVQQLMETFQMTLRDDLIETLQSHSDKQQTCEFFIRLMSIQEIVEAVECLSAFEMYREIIPLWTDDHSNYVGVYFWGPMQYRVCYINHEETDLSPAFRSVQSFSTLLEQHPESDWYDLPKDYPGSETNAALIANDMVAIAELNTALQAEELDEEIRCQLLFSIMALTPYHKLDTLMSYMDDENMYVQERACEILGFHKYEPAKSRLEEIAESGSHNGKTAARSALARMN